MTTARSTSRPAAVRAALALMGPPAGPCAFCGLPDRRHRLLEAVGERVRVGEDPAAVAEDHDLTIDAVMVAAGLGPTTRRDFLRAGPPEGLCPVERET